LDWKTAERLIQWTNSRQPFWLKVALRKLKLSIERHLPFGSALQVKRIREHLNR